MPYRNLRPSTAYTPNNGIKPTPYNQRGRQTLFLGGIQKGPMKWIFLPDSLA